MILQSKKSPMIVLHLGGMAAGLLVMCFSRGFAFARSNALSGFLLGSLLVVLSTVALLMGESRRLELDESGRKVILEITTRWRRRRLVIPFAEIQDFTLGRMGKTSDGSVYYDLVIRHRDGREIYLFGGCAFEGRMDRVWIEDLRVQFRAAVFARTARA